MRNHRLIFPRLLIAPIIALGCTKHSSTPGQPSVVGVDMKALGDFVFDSQTGSANDVPQRFRALDGKTVALEGFMWAPSMADDRAASFQFVYDIAPNEHHGPPLVQQRVFVSVPGGKTVGVANDEVRIVGTFHVTIEHDETGQVIQVFSMDLDHIDPL